MKKNVLYKLIVLLSLPIILVTLKSDKNGKFNASTSGCGGGSCHASTASVNTTCTLTGIPSAGYIPGTVYTLTATVNNATLGGGGFNLSNNSKGTFSVTGFTGVKISGTAQVTHTAPKAAASGITSWQFTWTAPVAGTGAVTMNMAGNAVNMLNNTAGDEWALASFVFDEAIPSSLNNNVKNKLTISPNPCNNYINFNEEANNIAVYDLSGKQVAVNVSGKKVDVQNLVAGNYIITGVVKNATFTNLFTKQ